MEELRTNDYLKGIVSNLPESPGIYQYLNTEGTIIYVGKAKNLKRRVSSYFNGFGVNKDISLAEKYLRLAADGGNRDAIIALQTIFKK